MVLWARRRFFTIVCRWEKKWSNENLNDSCGNFTRKWIILSVRFLREIKDFFKKIKTQWTVFSWNQISHFCENYVKLHCRIFNKFILCLDFTKNNSFCLENSFQKIIQFLCEIDLLLSAKPLFPWNEKPQKCHHRCHHHSRLCGSHGSLSCPILLLYCCSK